MKHLLYFYKVYGQAVVSPFWLTASHNRLLPKISHKTSKNCLCLVILSSDQSHLQIRGLWDMLQKSNPVLPKFHDTKLEKKTEFILNIPQSGIHFLKHRIVFFDISHVNVWLIVLIGGNILPKLHTTWIDQCMIRSIN